MKKETQCVQGNYKPHNGESRVAPITMSTTFKYESTDKVGDLFDLKESGFFYTRLGNPTTAVFEEKMAMLEGGVGALMTSSGQSASLISVFNIAEAGSHIVSMTEIYGGTFNLFNVTLKKMGIDVTFVAANDFDALEKAIRPNTKLVFGETIANPALKVLDIEKASQIAHKHGLPLIIDNTFATPYICRPIEFGADIVVHSTSKYTDGHAVALGGVIVDGGKFDWVKSGRFPSLTTPDESYHGMIYSRDCGAAGYIIKARVHLMRDMGCTPSPMNAFLSNLGLETLHLRMERHSSNALKAAEFLAGHKSVTSVKYPALKNDSQYALCQKYLGGLGSGVVTFELKSREAAVRFMDKLTLAAIVVHVADVRTGVLHPASSTHRQLTDAQLKEGGISPAMIRLSVGIENIDDIIEDLKKALTE